MDALDQIMDPFGRQQPGTSPVALVDSDVDHADPVMGVEHVDRVVRTNPDPVAQWSGITGGQCVDGQWWEREVVDAVHVPRHVDLIPVVAVNLDEHAHPACSRGACEPFDEVVGLRDHEARRSGTLDRVPDRVQPDEADVPLLETIEDLRQVRPAGVALDVDVDLLMSERRPHRVGRAVGEGDVVERWRRPRSVDHRTLVSVRHRSEHPLRGEEQTGVHRVVAVEAPVGELCRVDRHVVHDQVGHHVDGRTEFGDVGPCAQPRVDTGVVHGVESRVTPVDRYVERKHMHATERAGQLPGEERAKTGQVSCEAVGVRDELRLVAHVSRVVSRIARRPRRGWFPRPGSTTRSHQQRRVPPRTVLSAARDC